MIHKLLYLFVFFFSGFVLSQGDWVITNLAPLPEPTAYNAVCEATINNEKRVYSFGGTSDIIDSSSVHRRVFYYSVELNQWDTLEHVPDSIGKLGMRASFMNNRIYIVGGHAFDTINNEKIVSQSMHVFNPFLDTFEVDGANLPTPKTNHIQAVWRDSLIFVFGGADQTQNSVDNYFYNPAFDSWSSCTSLPENDFFKSEGGSGYILGDTIFYYGGQSGTFSPSAKSFLRKGIINKNDPTQIEWSFLEDISGFDLYNVVASGHDKTVFFFGGSGELYNFNGENEDGDLALGNEQIMHYRSSTDETTTFNLDISFKGINGIAKIGGGNWIVGGGVDSLGITQDQVYLLSNVELSGIEGALQPPFFGLLEFDEYYTVKTENIGIVSVYDIMGRTLFEANKGLADLHVPKSRLKEGMLIFVYDDRYSLPVSKKVVLIK